MFHRCSIVHIISCYFGLITLVAPATLPIPSDQSSTSKHPIILIFSFDGFRYDYVDRGFNPFLKNITKKGVSTDYLDNVFPTKTFTNHYSIATGMYAETHGVLGNSVFNEHGKCLKYGYELYHYNENILPMWALNEMSGDGRHSGCLMWAGCDFSYKNITPTYFQKFDQSMPWTKRIDTIMSWLLNREKPMNLLNAYFDEPDTAEHAFGPNSNQTNEKLKQIDNFLISFFDQLDKYPKLRDRINLIIMSDHGMIELKTDHRNNITDLIDQNKYTQCGSSVAAQILPKPGFEEEIYRNLTVPKNIDKTFTVFKREEQPDSWHFKNNRRNIGLFVMAKPPYVIEHKWAERGTHGYDTEVKEMRAFFTAIGPIFKQHYSITGLKNIDVYPLVAHVLKLQSPPEHVKPNGTLTTIANILEKYKI